VEVVPDQRPRGRARAADQLVEQLDREEDGELRACARHRAEILRLDAGDELRCEAALGAMYIATANAARFMCEISRSTRPMTIRKGCVPHFSRRR
jgi:hypothetical protein